MAEKKMKEVTKETTAKKAAPKKTAAKKAAPKKTASKKTEKVVVLEQNPNVAVEAQVEAKIEAVSGKQKKKILFAATECQPFIASGGLGDVIGSLPKEIVKEYGEEYDVRVILPLYSDIPETFRNQFEYLGYAFVRLAWRNQYCGVYSVEKDGVKFYFLDNEYYFKRNGLYGYFDDGERFAFFSRAVLDVLPIVGFMPDIIHAHDWQASLIPVYLSEEFCHKEGYENIKTVFTIHNIEYQGKYGSPILGDVLGLPDSAMRLLEYDGCVNFMKGGISAAHLVSTVSPSYAGEIENPYYASGLHYIIMANRMKMRGILNGIDYDFYNPETDAHIAANYSADAPEGKAENKRALQRELGLPEKDVPIIALISRLVEHKGTDLVKWAADELLNRDVQFVLLGTGNYEYENFFKTLEERYPDKVRALIQFNGALSRRIYAGADIFLMPSKSEPCGLAQMIAARYGTIPVVRHCGGLGDSIVDIRSGFGNGFHFYQYRKEEMLSALYAAIDYFDDKEVWKKLVDNAMRSDFSWKRSAVEYVKMYDGLI